jgi:hypothetical protein
VNVKDDPRIKAIAALADDKDLFCVVTCRDRDFDGNPYWRDLHLQDLTLDQVETITRYVFEDYKDEKEVTDNFLKFVWYNADERWLRLKELVVKPFFFTKAPNLLRCTPEFSCARVENT